MWLRGMGHGMIESYSFINLTPIMTSLLAIDLREAALQRQLGREA
jgi:hypothetical protein